jgi:hypothetical protein
MHNAGTFDDRWEMARGESLSTRLPGGEPVSGIYMLHFRNGERYVGQATNVVRRYAQHCRTYDDIAEVSFRAVSEPDLDEAEKATIAAVERRHQLRNKLLTGRPGGPTVLDLVVPPAQRLAWAQGKGTEPADTPRHVDLGATPPRGYQVLRARPDYPQLLDAVRAFLRVTICWPRTTEQRFWTITALPNTVPGKGWHRLVTLTANNLEILVLGEHQTEGVGGFINIAHLEPRPWTRHRLDRIAPQRERRRSPVGGDIDTIDFDGYSHLHRLVRYSPIARAAACLTTALMLKGSSMNSRHHCVHLVGDVLEPSAKAIDIREAAQHPR